MLRNSSLCQFRGYWGHPAHCHSAVYEHAGKTIIVATELESNAGTSITNMAEYLATDLWQKMGAPALEHFVWIERYADRGFTHCGPTLEESFDLVTFTAARPEWSMLANQQHYSTVLRQPQWKRVTQADVERLIGLLYVAPALADEPKRATPTKD